MGSEQELSENLEDKTILGKRKGRSRYHKARESHDKEHFISMLHQMNEEKAKLAEMDEDELIEEQKKKAKLKAMFRHDGNDDLYCPLIIKANMAGTLETIMQETDKIIAQNYQMQVIETGVGPISEKDVAQAVSTNAKIIAFDVPCATPIAKKVEAAGVVCRLHKLIYKFTDDLHDLAHDMKLAEAKAEGKNVEKQVLGSASVLQTFNVQTGKGKKD
jgi:translation initiation factor IF-2